MAAARATFMTPIASMVPLSWSRMTLLAVIGSIILLGAMVSAVLVYHGKASSSRSNGSKQRWRRNKRRRERERRRLAAVEARKDARDRRATAAAAAAARSNALTAWRYLARRFGEPRLADRVLLMAHTSLPPGVRNELRLAVHRRAPEVARVLVRNYKREVFMTNLRDFFALQRKSGARMGARMRRAALRKFGFDPLAPGLMRAAFVAAAVQLRRRGYDASLVRNAARADGSRAPFFNVGARAGDVHVCSACGGDWSYPRPTTWPPVGDPRWHPGNPHAACMTRAGLRDGQRLYNGQCVFVVPHEASVAGTKPRAARDEVGPRWAEHAPGPHAVVRNEGNAGGGDLDGNAGGGGSYRVRYEDGEVEVVETRFIVMMR